MLEQIQYVSDIYLYDDMLHNNSLSDAQFDLIDESFLQIINKIY